MSGRTIDLLILALHARRFTWEVGSMGVLLCQKPKIQVSSREPCKKARRWRLLYLMINVHFFLCSHEVLLEF